MNSKTTHLNTTTAILLTILSISSLILIGCKTSKQKKLNKQNSPLELSATEFLNIDCSEGTLKEQLSTPMFYPALLRENEIEGTVEIVITNIKGSIDIKLNETQLLSKSKEFAPKKEKMIRSFLHYNFENQLNKIAGENCPKLKNDFSTNIVVLYKINNSVLEPKNYIYDLLISGEKIIPQSKVNH